MAKAKFSDMFDTAQDRQFAGLMRDVLDKIDERFSQFDEATQAKFKDAAREIASMRDDLNRTQTDHRQRFYALAEHHQRGGAYAGPFPSADEARAFGLLVGAVIRGPQAVEKLYADDRFFAAISRSAV